MSESACWGALSKALSRRRKPVGPSITLSIGIGGLVLVLFLHVASRVRLHRPDLEGWLRPNRTAVASPPLLRALRRLSP
jgi:hypothetical protein